MSITRVSTPVLVLSLAVALSAGGWVPRSELNFERDHPRASAVLSVNPAARTVPPPDELMRPVLLFSDMNSGPNDGNTDNSLGQLSGRDGAIVTIWGFGLGDSPAGSQIVCNGAPARVYFWGHANLQNYRQVTFQVSHAARTGLGDITAVVHGLASNALPFTVRPGKIYFVSTMGADTNRGGFTSPWRTLSHARDLMKRGDITYAMNGVGQTADDGSGWDSSLMISSSGTSSAPIAMVAYPAASVRIGDSFGPSTGIRTGRGITNYWVIAGFIIRGKRAALSTWNSNYWRIVANDISCPNGNGEGACLAMTESSNQEIYGNSVHDTGTSNASALYHGVYFGTDSNHLDFGWNIIANVHGCRGLQIHSTPQSGETNSGHNQYDIKIHDSTIHDTQCDGIIVDTIDPSRGEVALYNNVLYNIGKGPNNPEMAGAWSGINIVGNTESGPSGSGTVEIFSNTIYAFGTFSTPPYSQANAAIIFHGRNSRLYVHIRNNLICSIATTLNPSGVPYFVIWNTSTGRLCSDNCPWFYGSNNLLFGAGLPVANVQNIRNSINGDPRFVNSSQSDFHLRSGSAAIDTGDVIRGLSLDIDGNRRPQGSAYDIGAYEFVTPGVKQSTVNH